MNELYVYFVKSYKVKNIVTQREKKKLFKPTVSPLTILSAILQFFIELGVYEKEPSLVRPMGVFENNRTISFIHVM